MWYLSAVADLHFMTLVFLILNELSVTQFSQFVFSPPCPLQTLQNLNQASEREAEVVRGARHMVGAQRDGRYTRAYQVASGEGTFQPEGQRRKARESISTQQRGAL